MGGYTGNASEVQTWLLTNGYKGPFNIIGVYTATGFWGMTSAGAYAQALAACK
jgi:hypothetical protein